MFAAPQNASLGGGGVVGPLCPHCHTKVISLLQKAVSEPSRWEHLSSAATVAVRVLGADSSWVGLTQCVSGHHGAICLFARS